MVIDAQMRKSGARTVLRYYLAKRGETAVLGTEIPERSGAHGVC